MKALIFGTSGQDGSYLSELLIEKDYQVIGVCRRSSVDTTERISHLLSKNQKFQIVEGDIIDPNSVNDLVATYEPDEIYNLAAQSHVATSFKQPIYTFQSNALAVMNILEAIRHILPSAKFYQASTSEMFGSNTSKLPTFPMLERINNGFEGMADASFPKWKQVQNESTAFAPRSPYAVAKMAAHQMVSTYRESYNLHASCGILFNHESERRGEKFVTRKITQYVASLVRRRWRDGRIWRYDVYTPEEVVQLALGNLDAYRDWGHAEDYVRAMWMMLQQEKPDDYVIGTGETHNVKEFLVAAFKYIGIDQYEDYVRIDSSLFRPAEVTFLCADASKAERVLGWKPEIKFDGLVSRMVEHDIRTQLS